MSLAKNIGGRIGYGLREKIIGDGPIILKIYLWICKYDNINHDYCQLTPLFYNLHGKKKNEVQKQTNDALHFCNCML
jgi:hypothetical protein